MASRVRQVKRQQQLNKTNRVTFALNGTGEVTLPGAPSLHTHSSKFPIEREVIVKSSNEKQCKIPNLSDYMRRAKPSIAPDAPPKQIAWTQQMPKNEGESSTIIHEIAAHQVYKAQPMSILDSTKDSEPSPIRPANAQELGPATSTPEADGARGLPQRTYQSLKDMISSRFAKQNGNSVQTPTSSNLDASLSPQSQLRQHGVYIGSPQPSQQQQQPVEMRGMGRSHQQQQRMYEQQQQQQQQRGQFPPQQQQQQQLQQQQQVTGTPQMQYKYSNLPLPPSTTYQPIMETPSSTWKHYNGEGAIPKNQGGDNVPNQGTSYQAVNTANEAGLKNYNQDCIAYNPAEPRYNQSRPPLSYQQQYRGSQRNTRPAPANSGGTSGGYQTSHGQNDYHAQQNTQYSQGSVIVHASQDGHPHHSVEDGKATSSSSKPLDIHREGPQGAAALAGPSLKDDDDEGGFVKRGAQSDSGRGSTVYSSAKTSAEDTTPPLGEQSEWSERVENELRQILNGPGGTAPPGGGGGQVGGGLTSATGPTAGSSESFSSVSPPLPPLSPHSSDDTYRRPRLTGFGGKSGNSSIWTARTKDKSRSHKHGKSNLLGIEIDSMLEENNSSEDEDYNDTRAIRKQLEGLETMYAQVLKLLGVKQKHGLPRYEASDPRINKRRTCGSVSSIPSSVSSRPIRATDRRGRAGKVRDVRGVNKRFQRLESHVVTLARSVAHLSSEMRTQHIMMQEMEMMRGELAALRVQSNLQQQQTASHQISIAQQSAFFSGGSGPGGGGLNTSKQANSTPDKVKRLTKFFGDEPPLLRLFLRRLGYEKYAGLFEKERIGLLELPFMSEERLHKLGIPLGPRLRIMQQAHLANPNTLCVL
ncbi:SAM domain (Sterile alpha motif) [Nesidiocoris tenuis]|nr:SAM domain (Sterile alpha motif) [Nesidiocoris tenuis]